MPAGIVVIGGAQVGGVTTRVVLASTAEALWTADHGAAVRAVAADADGHVITGGNRVGGVTTRKYGPDGALLWSVDHGNQVRGVAVDSSGNVVTVGDQVGSPPRTTRKYDPDGNLLWSVDHGADVYAVAVDDAGNVYTAGNQLGSSPYTTTRKYNSSGTLQWSHTHGAGAVSIAVIHGGSRIAVGGIAYSYTLDILSATTGTADYRYTHEGVQVNGIAAGRTSAGATDQTLVTASNRTATNRTTRDLDDDVGGAGTTYHWSADHGGTVYAVAVSGQDGATFTGGNRVGTVTTRKYDDAGTEVAADGWPLDHGSTVYGVAWSPYTPTLDAYPPALPFRLALGVPDVRVVVFAPALPRRWALGTPTVTPNPLPPDLAASPLQTVYRLRVSGGSLLELSFSALQCQRRLGESTWITATIPTCSAALLADLVARRAADGRLIVFAGTRAANGTETLGEFLQAAITEIDGEWEAGMGMVSLRGRLVPTAFTATTRPLRGVTRRGVESNGRRFAECAAADPLLRPNDSVNDGAGTWTAGSIWYRIEPSSGTMRVGEAG